MVLSEDECILNGWNTHFQRLSTPDPGIENTEDPSAMECTLIEEILKDPKKRKENDVIVFVFSDSCCRLS
jgi:hypothetical protein